MGKNERYVVGLDIGTSKIACVVGEVRESGAVDIVGIGEAPSRGIRRGIVVNLDATAEAVRNAVEQAELMAGVSVEAATVGLAGGHIRTFNSRGVVAVTGRDHTVSREDVSRVLEAARAVSIPEDREIVHVLPQEYAVDEQPGIANPVGLTGSRLEANVHIVTGASTQIQNLVTCVNRAGVEVRDMVLETLATAEAVLTRDEKELGVALVDIGGGTTDLAVFERGSLWHSSVVPVGGGHFTNDLAVGLRAPIPEAERLKRQYGCCLASMIEEDEAIEVPTVGGRKPRLLSRQVMAEILQPRAEELFAILQGEIERAGFERALNAGVVLTGGGCLLPGMTDVAEQVFELPVRQGQVTGVGGLTEPASGPEYAVAIGLALYGARHRESQHRAGLPVRAGLLTRVSGRMRAWFQIF